MNKLPLLYTNEHFCTQTWKAVLAAVAYWEQRIIPMRKAKIVGQSENKPFLLNPGRTPLTPEKLRELSGLHDLTDEEAVKIIESIQQFAKVLYRFMTTKCSEENGNVQTEPVKSSIQNNAA